MRSGTEPLFGELAEGKPQFKFDEVTDFAERGIKLFYARLGQNPPASPEDIITNIATVTGYYEMFATGNEQQVLKRFNTLCSIYNINEAMDNEDFLKAFYEAVKCIPAVGSIMGGIESLFSIIYSETFNNAMLRRTRIEIEILGNCQSDYCNRERLKFEKNKTLSENNLKRLKQQKIDDIHNRICTCPK